MKITIYELVGLVINGKAPRQIKYSNRIYDYNEKQEDYECFIVNYYDYLLDNTNTFQQFNDEVEIIEEDKDIEKLKIEHMENNPSNKYVVNEFGTKCFLTKHSKILADKINEIIDEVNKLKNN